MTNKLIDFFTKPVVKCGTIGLLALGLGAFGTNYLNNKAHNADIAVIEAQSAADSLMYTDNIARINAIALDNSNIKGSVTINYHTDTIEGN